MKRVVVHITYLELRPKPLKADIEERVNDSNRVDRDIRVINMALGGIFVYCPSFRSPARLIELATTSWLHIENWDTRLAR